MSEAITMPQALFFTIARGGTTTFVNASHVTKIEIDVVERKSGVLYMHDGTQIELGANEG